MRKKVCLLFMMLVACATPLMQASELDDLTFKQQRLKSDVDKTTDKIVDYQAEIDQLNRLIEDNNTQIKSLEKEQEELKVKIASSQKDLSSSLQVMQKLNNSNVLVQYFFEQDDENILLKLMNIQIITQQLSADISQFTMQVSQLNSAIEEVSTLQTENNQHQADISKDLERQMEMEADLKADLADVDSEITNLKYVTETEPKVTVVSDENKSQTIADEQQSDQKEEEEEKTPIDNNDDEQVVIGDQNTDSEQEITEPKPEQIDDVKPTISGADNVTIDEGDSFDEMAGVSANDNVDGDITADIIITGSVDVSTPKTYSLTYSVSDSAGNTTSKVRKVTVKADETSSENDNSGSDVIYSGNVSAYKNEIMASAGIASSDYQYVDYIVTKESGWNSTATNAFSGAYGLCQALPGSKMASAGSDWQTNAVTQMKWCDSYAQSRYGSWLDAYNFWIANNWW